MGIYNPSHGIVRAHQLITEKGYSEEYLTVNTAELYAIYEAVNCISHLQPGQYYIASDSFFAINSVKYLNSKKPFHLILSGLIRNKILALASKEILVEITKVEAHKCEESETSAGNQAADMLAGIAATGIMWAPTVKP